MFRGMRGSSSNCPKESSLARTTNNDVVCAGMCSKSRYAGIANKRKTKLMYQPDSLTRPSMSTYIPEMLCAFRNNYRFQVVEKSVKGVSSRRSGGGGRISPMTFPIAYTVLAVM